MEEIFILIFILIGTIIISFSIGYAWATRCSLLAIENVNNWISNHEANCWVQYSMYEELEKKYIKLLSEYEQYRGMIKAIDDCGDKHDTK